MFIKFDHRSIFECSEEMNRISFDMDSIHSKIEKIQMNCSRNYMTGMSGQLITFLSLLKNYSEQWNAFSKQMATISEIYYYADMKASRENENLMNLVESIKLSENLYDFSIVKNGELVTEPWLEKLLKEASHE